jgi:GNAT superfamily N-acetyltransferase
VSGGSPTGTPTLPDATEASCRVRAASLQDVKAVAAAVRELLLELGGSPPVATAMEATARELLEDDHAGALFVADTEGALVGVLAASWQTAIHAPGRYALIQDLWVDPSWRSRAVGAALLGALFERAREREITRVEVGLPHERFAGIRATQAFYHAHGFAPLGPRMRRLL